uniref:Uncharacterized protein n=1 Tax=Siphoviridae sp. ctqwO1 TaxID=2826472 RepID=A0A8S5QP17_9CAUD|nr:MAG TPA: hypothetical protein [Siphoviridae sp. ctqwO1]
MTGVRSGKSLGILFQAFSVFRRKICKKNEL